MESISRELLAHGYIKEPLPALSAKDKDSLAAAFTALLAAKSQDAQLQESLTARLAGLSYEFELLQKTTHKLQASSAGSERDKEALAVKLKFDSHSTLRNLILMREQISATITCERAKQSLIYSRRSA